MVGLCLSVSVCLSVCLCVCVAVCPGGCGPGNCQSPFQCACPAGLTGDHCETAGQSVYFLLIRCYVTLTIRA